MTARNGSGRISSVTARLAALEMRAGLGPASPVMPPEKWFLIYTLAALSGGASGRRGARGRVRTGAGL